MTAQPICKGERYGYLTVIGFVSVPNGRTYHRTDAVCLCDCGKESVVQKSKLRRGQTKSCGCDYRNKAISSAMLGVNTCPVEKRHGLVGTKTYNTWVGMKQRCLDRNHAFYDCYGGRGITVCDSWLSFKNFLEEMGERPEGKTLDRIDNDKGYYRENCRWATNIEQANNKRN